MENIGLDEANKRLTDLMDELEQHIKPESKSIAIDLLIGIIKAGTDVAFASLLAKTKGDGNDNSV